MFSRNLQQCEVLTTFFEKKSVINNKLKAFLENNALLIQCHNVLSKFRENCVTDPNRENGARAQVPAHFSSIKKNTGNYHSKSYDPWSYL
jgi:hypothetical protein